MTAKKKPDLIPPDKKRCQAEFRSGSFMTLGPRSMVRCEKKPTVIVHEVLPGKDRQKGSMSLCNGCLGVFKMLVFKGLSSSPLYKIEHLRKVHHDG